MPDYDKSSCFVNNSGPAKTDQSNTQKQHSAPTHRPDAKKEFRKLLETDEEKKGEKLEANSKPKKKESIFDIPKEGSINLFAKESTDTDQPLEECKNQIQELYSPQNVNNVKANTDKTKNQEKKEFNVFTILKDTKEVDTGTLKDKNIPQKNIPTETSNTKQSIKEPTPNTTLAKPFDKKTTEKQTTEDTIIAYGEVQPSNVKIVTNTETKINYNTSADSSLKTTDLNEIVSQVVDQIKILDNQSGQTDISIKLKYPPIFEGATVTISQFESAHGEYNITFSDLSNTAKNILDLRQNQLALKSNLEEKGFAVHIVITTEQTLDVDGSGSPTNSDHNQQEHKQQQDQPNSDE